MVFACDVERLGIRDLGGVAICDSDAQRDSRLRWPCDATDGRLDSAHSIAELIARLEAKKWFDSVFDDCWCGD
ncbi:MAG: hypothetical protein EAZ43_11860 [Betaproteobacteria bacterium]|nr:MAG: hypothetical protein EAZ43_11860 [Betaproteobacteria bacterium]